MNQALKLIGLSAVVMAVAGCPNGDDDDQQTGNSTDTGNEIATEQTEAETPVDNNTLAIAAGDKEFIVDLQDIEVVLPTPQSYEGDMDTPAEGRLFHLDVKAFCPSLSGEVTTMEEYTEGCRDIIENGNRNEASAQDLVTIFACRASGDAFYAPIPALNYDAAYPFLNAEYDFNLEANYSSDRFFTEDGMIRQSERFGNDTFSVYNTEEVGTRDIAYAQEMRDYIAKRDSTTNHQIKDPMCNSKITKNLGEPRPR